MSLAVVTPFPSQHFLRITDVCKITALSQSFVYSLQAKGQFPRSRKIAAKVSVWLESEVQEWMQEQWEQAA
jgi:predicted DNA-binding transcriptional regulator AlpA